MDAIIIVGIVFGSILALAGLLCGTILLLVKMKRTGATSKGGKAEKEEAMMIQEIYRGLDRMEQRVEALETILMDGREKRGDRDEKI